MKEDESSLRAEIFGNKGVYLGFNDKNLLRFKFSPTHCQPSPVTCCLCQACTWPLLSSNPKAGFPPLPCLA